MLFSATFFVKVYQKGNSKLLSSKNAKLILLAPLCPYTKPQVRPTQLKKGERKKNRKNYGQM